MEIRPIAHIRTDFPEKFGVPRQSGVVRELRGRVVFGPEYRAREAFRGIDGFSHLWLIWQFSHNPDGKWAPTVRPPGLGATKGWGCSQAARPFGPTPLGCPAWSSAGWTMRTQRGRCW